MRSILLVTSGSVPGLQSPTELPEILGFYGWVCAPPPQRKGPQGTPLRVPSTPAESHTLVPGWRATKIPTPVGGTSEGPHMRPAGACMPHLTDSGSLLTNPAPSRPASAPVARHPLISPLVAAPCDYGYSFPPENLSSPASFGSDMIKILLVGSGKYPLGEPHTMMSSRWSRHCCFQLEVNWGYIFRRMYIVCRNVPYIPGTVY